MANLWTADASGLTSAAGAVNADDGNWTADGFIASGVQTQVSGSPQFDARLAGYALVIASAFTAGAFVPYQSQASVPQDSAYFAAETYKTQIWKAQPPPVPKAEATYVLAPEQTYTNVPPSIQPSLIAGHTPPVIPYQYGAPQLADLTQQAVFNQPWHGPQGAVPPYEVGIPQADPSQLAAVLIHPSAPQGPVAPYASAYPIDTSQLQARYALPVISAIPGISIPYLVAPQQSYTDVPPSIQKALVSGQTPPVIQYQYSAPQIDLNLPARYTSPAFPQGPVLPYLWAIPQVDLTIPAVYSRPAFPQGPVPAYEWSFQTNTGQLSAQYTLSATSSFGVLGSYQGTLPQLGYQPAQAFSAPSIGVLPPTGPVPLYLQAAPQVDLTVKFSFVWPPSVPVVLTPTADPWPVHWPMPPVSQAKLKKYLEQQRRMATRRARQIAVQVQHDQELRQDLERALKREIPIEKVAEQVKGKSYGKREEIDWEQVRLVASRLLEKPIKAVQTIQARQIIEPDPEEDEIKELNELQSLYAQDFYERLDALQRLIRKKLS